MISNEDLISNINLLYFNNKKDKEKINKLQNKYKLIYIYENF